MYTPDKWLLIKINGNNPHYRVFASWYGGYLNGDSWRMNSGVTSVTEDDEFYYFSGSSGSVYNCHKKARGISGYGSGVLNYYTEQYPELNIEIINDDIDVMSLEYK